MASDETVTMVRDILSEALGIELNAGQVVASTSLLGGIPEFDSMAVVTVVTLIEEQIGVEFADDELSAETFETIGSLADFVQARMAE